MNFLVISLFIRMITCFLKRLLVVMVILGLDLLFDLLMTFWTCSIFLSERFKNVSLIFSVFLMMFFGADELDSLVGEVALA